jgi:RNA-directed DNA polymerase
VIDQKELPPLKHTDLIRRMSADLGLLPPHLESIIRTAPLRYKKFTIPKRNGSLRQVAQPAREVKEIQRWVVRELRSHLPMHDAVSAYEEGCSIIRNANIHKASRFILKMDFRDFFPSITISDVMRHVEKYCAGIYGPLEIKQLAFACVWTPTRKPPLRLCIGAPSSPFISNSVLYEFDEAIFQYAHTRGVRYSRYADDMIFSTNRDDVLKNFPRQVRSVLKRVGLGGLRLNNAKTVHASRAGKRVVTGIVLTPDGSLSVGRDRKRLVRSMFHRFKLGLLTPEEQATLSGLLAFIDSVEPGFSDKLERRYDS